ncbi:MAG: hypothetical protein ACRCZF_27110 [Gemmataceae bacterium]
MSIVRVGLSENQKYGDGYDAIFGSKRKRLRPTAVQAAAKKPKTKKMPADAPIKNNRAAKKK